MMNKFFCKHIASCYLSSCSAGAKILLFILPLFFVSVLASAQVYDTVEIIDTAVTVPLEDYEEADEEEGEIDYFDQLIGTEKQKTGLRRLPDSVKNAIKKDDAFWYADGNWKKPPPEKKKKKSFIRMQWFRDLLWGIMIVVFIIVLIWFLAASNINLFRRKQVAMEAYEEETLSDNIFEINYGKEIHKAMQAGNYRLAVRLMFLQMLKNLSDRNIIQYKQDRTNLDYLLQLHSTAYYQDFFRITRNYEYTWYGEFRLDEHQFSIVKKDFEQFERKLN